MHQTVTGHDAIGNDIEAIFKLLNAQGRRCVVFANNTLNKQVTYIEESELDSVLQEEDNIILYLRVFALFNSFKFLFLIKLNLSI